MKTVLPKTVYPDHATRETFFRTAVERVRALPGVQYVGYTNALPLDYKGDSTSFTVEGHPPPKDLENDACDRLVSADYLRALGVPLRRGRHFDETDVATSMPVTIVNEAMARRYWPGEDALGRRFKLYGASDDTPWVTVVGITADVRQNGIDEPIKPEMYFPYAQCDYVEVFAPKTFAVRTTGDPAALAPAIQREIASIDRNQPVSDVKTMGEILSKETSGKRLGTLLVGAFAAAALLLASIGIYGVLAQRVAQTKPEVGVRLALGAKPADVLKMVVGRGMRLVGLGTVAGLALSLALTRFLSSMLFGVGAYDPATLVGVPVVLGIVGLLACYVPARRASRVDPTIALRAD